MLFPFLTVGVEPDFLCYSNRQRSETNTERPLSVHINEYPCLVTSKFPKSLSNVWSSTPVGYELGTKPCASSQIVTLSSAGQWCWWSSYSNISFSILDRKEVWGNTKVQCNEHGNTQLNRIQNHLYPPVINNPIFLKPISLFLPISLPVSEGTIFDIFLTSTFFYIAAILHV